MNCGNSGFALVLVPCVSSGGVSSRPGPQVITSIAHRLRSGAGRGGAGRGGAGRGGAPGPPGGGGGRGGGARRKKAPAGWRGLGACGARLWAQGGQSFAPTFLTTGCSRRLALQV
jgi:hypothetical protein